MKKYILAILIICLVSIASFNAWAGGDIHCREVTAISSSGNVIGASGTCTYEKIDLSAFNPDGYFSVQMKVVGSGASVTLGYQISNDGSNWYTVTSAIATTVGQGVGTVLYSFSPMMSRYIRLYATEAAGSKVTDIDITFCLQ